MIVFMALQKHGYIHEMNDACFIQLVQDNCDEDILFVGFKNHLVCVKALISDYEYEEMYVEDIPEEYGFNLNYAEKYKKIISQVICKYSLSSNDKIIFLTTAVALMQAMYEVNINIGMKCFFLEHNSLSDFALNKGAGRFTCEKELYIKLMKEDEFYFICYHPLVHERLYEILGERVYDKFLFLHLPLMLKKTECRHNIIPKILIYGRVTGRPNFKKLLKSLQHYSLDGKLEIGCLRSISINKMDDRYLYPNCNWLSIYSKLNGYSNDEIAEKIAEADWILFPYDHSEYYLGMSAILIDAIANRKPILTLDCDVVQWYNQKHMIGYCEANVDALAERIKMIAEKKIGQKEVERFYFNSEKLGEEMLCENNRLIKEILK